jgi:hypothetical protein
MSHFVPWRSSPGVVRRDIVSQGWLAAPSWAVAGWMRAAGVPEQFVSIFIYAELVLMLSAECNEVGLMGATLLGWRWSVRQRQGKGAAITGCPIFRCAFGLLLAQRFAVLRVGPQGVVCGWENRALQCSITANSGDGVAGRRRLRSPP